MGGEFSTALADARTELALPGFGPNPVAGQLQADAEQRCFQSVFGATFRRCPSHTVTLPLAFDRARDSAAAIDTN